MPKSNLIFEDGSDKYLVLSSYLPHKLPPGRGLGAEPGYNILNIEGKES